MKKTFFLLLILACCSGCSVQKLALKTTSGLFAYGIEALYAEPDLEIAEIAIASNLKLLEGFHLADPKNKAMLQLLLEGYSGYSLGFLEDTQPERASMFYLRSRDYGFALLEQTKAFKKGIPEKEADFVERLPLIKESELPALFWTAFAWAGWINVNRDDPQAAFDLSKVKAMMTRVMEIDETFFFGSAHLFWGSTYGSVPRMLGGDPDKAKMHFDRAIEISGGKFVMAYVYSAQFYALMTLDDVLFEEDLQKVLDAPQDIMPGYELMTSIAKKKATGLLAQKDDLF